MRKSTLPLFRLPINKYLALTKPNPDLNRMNPDFKAMKLTLQKKELELQRLLRQMQLDKLHNSTVFKNLESELKQVKQQLVQPEESAK